MRTHGSFHWFMVIHYSPILAQIFSRLLRKPELSMSESCQPSSSADCSLLFTHKTGATQAVQ